MSNLSSFSSQITAALSALALSVVLISGTVTIPQAEAAPALIASAYVGALA